MKAFDSISMGHRCKGWSLRSGTPSNSNHIVVRGTSGSGTSSSSAGEQWIVNAVVSGRITEVQALSTVVLDGGPRWVLSTAFGFVTGGLWWTVVYAAVLVLAAYTMFVNTSKPSSTSDAEMIGMVAYTILAVAISVASVPGEWRLSEWKALASGLVVEVFLCVFLVVGAAIVHGIFGSALGDSSGLYSYADFGRWSIPALLWAVASHYRDRAVGAVEMKLRSYWCFHPMGPDRSQYDQDKMNGFWNEWSKAVVKCAGRVGGHSMLGFSASDLEVLSACSPTPDARRQIQLLGSGLPKDGSTSELWVRQSLAFVQGYQTRLAVTGPSRSSTILGLEDVQTLVKSLVSGGSQHDDVASYRSEIESSPRQARYPVMAGGDGEQWIFAGALVADSDSRVQASPLPADKFGPRLAVAISLIAKGTDALARLACYPDVDVSGSSSGMLISAIDESVKVLVSELASRAGVANVDGLGKRGLAYVEGVPKTLSYSPDELVAASHTEEVFVTNEETFSASSNAMETFTGFWQGWDGVEKRVDVSDMVPSGADPRLGWMCHLGFTLAILTVRLFGGGSQAIVVLLLVAIPALDKRVSRHIDGHYFMIYVNYLLNYTRLISRWASLAQRGQASIDKSNNLRQIVFLFVNILPVVACYVFNEKGKEWAWWVSFAPCVLANGPGLYNTLCFRWASAFEYEWWSWHLTNRWFSGRGYLSVEELRQRVGRNVLAVVVNASATTNVEHVTPKRGKVGSTCRFVVVGGGRLPDF